MTGGTLASRRGAESIDMSDLPAFSYTRPRDLATALVALARPGACIYAGGTDVLVALAARQEWLRFVRQVVDVKDITEAKGIRDLGTHLRIGALVTADELSGDATVRRYARVLAEAASETSAPALRRRGTVGGNVTTPHAAGDITTALLALGATVHVARRHSTDEYPLADFMRLQAEQWPRQHLLVAVTVRKCRRSAFEKIGARIAFSRSLVAIGVASLDGRFQIALGGLHDRPFLSPAIAAAAATPRRLDAALADECRPPDDGLASRAYRLRLAATLIRRAMARSGPL